MVLAGGSMGDLLLRYRKACELLETEAYKDTAEFDSDYWALLAGIVAGGRGCFRIVRPSSHDVAGDIRVQFDFYESDELFTLFRRYFNEECFWERTDRENVQRLVLAGEDAFAFTAKIFSLMYS
jgi:hypothetical protein